MAGKDGTDIPPPPEYGAGEKKSSGDTNERIFVIVFLASFAFLVTFTYLSLSVYGIGAATVSGTGGFTIAIDELIGEQVIFYPSIGESASCEATFADPRVGNQSEKGLVALEAEVDQIVIPATSDLRLQKDIPTPDITPLEGVRISAGRRQVINNPSYPPVAPESGVVSNGQVPQSYLDQVILPGVELATSINDGYSDVRFARTDPIPPGTTGVDIEIVAEGFTDYSDADPVNYPIPAAVRPDRYLDGVQLQQLNNQNTGNEGGYEDYTFLNNTDEEPKDGVPFLERGTNTAIDVTAVGADPLFGPVDTVRSSLPIGIPNPPVGSDSAQTYIDTVTFDTLNDGTTGDDGGYRQEFNRADTPRVNKGSSITISVDGVKKTGNFGESPGAADPGLGSNFDCGKGCSDQMYVSWGGWRGHATTTNDPGVSGTSSTFWHNSGDDGGYGDYTNYNSFGELTGPELAEPGETVTLGMCLIADNSGANGDDEAGVSIGRAFVDWDEDGTFEGDYFMGVAVASDVDNGETVEECPTRTITVPESVNPGSATLRYMTNSDTVGEGDDPPNPNFEADGTNTSGSGEADDYTIHIQPGSQVSAFFDWTQDGNFEDEVVVGESLDRSGTFSYSETVNVPEDAISGSTILRVVHRNQIQEPVSTDGEIVANSFIGETHDYTTEVADQRTDSAAYVYFDWNRDGEFDDEQFVDSTTSNNGQFTLAGSISTPTGAKAGSTIMRVVHQQDGWATGEPDTNPPSFPANPSNFVGPGPNATDVNGEFHDYTVNVEPDGSYIRAWADWDGGGPQQIADFGTTGDGFGEGNFNNEGKFRLSDTFDVPGGLTNSVHLLRVTHKQAIPSEGPPSFGEGTDWKGETLDYTIVTDTSIDPNTANLTLGQANFVVTQLSASDLRLSGDVLIQESFTDNTTENPKFGPQGEFQLGGKEARLVDVDGIAHFVSFSFFQFPELDIELKYFNQSTGLPGDFLQADSQCGVAP